MSCPGRLVEALDDEAAAWRCGECDLDVGGFFDLDSADDGLLAACAVAQARDPENCTFLDSPLVATATVKLAVDTLGGHGLARFFAAPVDAATAPGYAKVVVRPMDLATVGRNLARGDYDGARGAARAVADVRAIWHACALYNDPDSPIGRCGRILHALWSDAFEPAVARGLALADKHLLMRHDGALKAEKRAADEKLARAQARAVAAA